MKAALLDFDGTLVHLPVDWDRLRADIAAALSAHGFSGPLRRVYSGVAQALAEMESRGDPPALRAALRRRINRIMTEAEAAVASNAYPLPDSQEFVAALRGHDYKVIVQSSNSVSVIRDVLARLRFPPVDAIVGRESARQPKPNSTGVRRALRELGLRGGDCVVVGDGDFDVQLGQAIDATTVRIGNGNPRADYEIQSLSDALPILTGSQRLQKVAS